MTVLVSVACAGCDGQAKQSILTIMVSNTGPAQDHFSRELKALREGRRWSQGELERRLAEKGIQLHSTTIAKIEKGDRPVNVVEAAAIADLFGKSVDALLGRGRQMPDDSTLTFTMVNLLNYAGDAEKQSAQARGTTADIEDMLEDVAERFNSPYIQPMQRAARDMGNHLDKACGLAQKVMRGASMTIADQDKATPK